MFINSTKSSMSQLKGRPGPKKQIKAGSPWKVRVLKNFKRLGFTSEYFELHYLVYP